MKSLICLFALTAMAVDNASCCCDEKCSIKLFRHYNFKGPSRVLDSPTPNFANIGFNDQVSSFKITGPCKWHLYQHNNYQGLKTTVGPGDYARNANLLPGGNDQMSSAKAECMLILYRDFNYKGPSKVLTESTPNFSAIGFNDRVSSMKVLACKWKLFEHANFGGVEKCVAAPAGYEHDLSVLPGGNDKMSSAEPE